MRAGDFHPGLDIRPLKLSVRDTPHLVIEPTLECNLNCRICYNRDRGFSKSLAEIRSEIDLGLRKRRLETISILGGEPTLHPDLPEIVRYIKRRRLVCQVLTNGIVLRSAGGEALLDRLVAAGLDRIIFHVDIGQYPSQDAADKVAHELFALAEARRLFCSLAVTVYPENQGTISALMRRFAGYRYFDGILATLTRNPDRAEGAGAANESELTMLDEYRALSSELQVEPATYLPTSLDDADVSWLIYFYYLNARTGRTFDLSPVLNRVMRLVLRGVFGRYPFAMTLNPRWFPVSFPVTVLLELVLRGGRFARLRELLHDSERGKAIRFQYIVVQQGPEYNPARGRTQLCYHCPDATIRNGKLTPVCVADRINPLDPNRKREPAADELYRTVYEHLEEL